MKASSRFSALAAASFLLLAAAQSAPAQEPIGDLPVEPAEGVEPAAAPPAAAEPEAAAAPVEDAATSGQQDVAATDETAVRPSNAAFMQPLGRLSSILGSIHFLRQICGDPQAEIWRQKMNALLVAQEPNEADRRILVASFNSGYRAFESTYRACTPAADIATRRYLQEGTTLSRDISARYGN